MIKKDQLLNTDKARIAQIVSFVFHPFLMAPLAVACVLYLSSGDVFSAVWWAGLCVLLCTVPLAVFLVYKLARSELSDVDISVREERYSVYLFGLVCMIACFGVLVWLQAPRVVIDLFVGGLIVTAIFALTTRFLTKVSAHAGAMAAVTVAVAFYSWLWALVLAIATGLVVWSRLTLKRHTSVELVSGLGIAGGTIFLALMLRP